MDDVARRNAVLSIRTLSTRYSLRCDSLTSKATHSPILSADYAIAIIAIQIEKWKSQKRKTKSHETIKPAIKPVSVPPPTSNRACLPVRTYPRPQLQFQIHLPVGQLSRHTHFMFASFVSFSVSATAPRRPSQSAEQQRLDITESEIDQRSGGKCATRPKVTQLGVPVICLCLSCLVRALLIESLAPPFIDRLLRGRPLPLPRPKRS